MDEGVLFGVTAEAADSLAFVSGSETAGWLATVVGVDCRRQFVTTAQVARTAIAVAHEHASQRDLRCDCDVFGAAVESTGAG